MPLYLSASSIKAYLNCSRMYYHRRYNKKEAKSFPAMDMGTVAHATLETYWRDRAEALAFAEKESYEYNLGVVEMKKVAIFVNTFFDNFTSLVGEKDEIELEFKIPIAENVFVVGKMDRVTLSGLVIDWKTNARPPKNISNDPQFILYSWAYEQLFNKKPVAVFFASLSKGTLIKYRENEANVNILMNNVIPSMIKTIEEDNFICEGRIRQSAPCFMCSFKEFCWNELDSRNTIA